MRRLQIVVEVEVIECQTGAPGVALFHVERYGPLRDVFFVRLADGRWRSVTPVGAFGGHDLPMRWMGDLPPLPMLAETAFPELAR